MSAPRRRVPRRHRRRAPLALPAGLLVAALLFANGRAGSQSDPLGAAGGILGATSEDEPIHVDADRLEVDRERDAVAASGDVVVKRGASVLAADRVEIDRGSGEAKASGSVVLEDPQARVQADEAWFELEDETGYLDDAEIYLSDSRFQLGGARMEKGIGQTYHVWDGRLTTCQCDDGAPDWSITGERIDVDLNGWGTVRGGRFRVKDVPLFYMPYGLFPVRRDRHSGFLFPRVGYSNNRGFQWVQPFYWAIDKTSDATISLDVETAARIGAIGEYRYLLAPDAGGLLTASYFNESIRGRAASQVVQPQQLADPTVPENRGSVIGYHQQPGPWKDSRFYVRPFWVSDNLFLREMNTLSYLPAVGAYSTVRRYTDSRIGLVKSWDWGMFQAEADYYQDLIQKQSRVPQPLPRLDLSARRTALDGRVRLALNAEAVEYWRAPLASGPRLDIAPEARVPYRLGRFGFGSLRMVLRETTYYLDSNEVPIIPTPLPGPKPTPGPGPTPTVAPPAGPAPLPTRAVPHFQHREIAQFAADFNTELSRVYRVGFGNVSRMKHTIEPYLRYAWVPTVDQDDLPVYDAVDRINARNLVTYGIVSRLLGRIGTPVDIATGPGGGPGDDDAGLATPIGAISSVPTASAVPREAPPSLATDALGQVQELARAYLQQSYAISKPFYLQPGDPQPQYLSGLDGGLRVTPMPWFGVSGRGVWSFAENRLLYAEAGVNFFDPRPVRLADDQAIASLRPTNSASIFYQFNSGGTLENVNFAATMRVTDHFAFAYLGRFDALDTRFLENWLGLRVISKCECWVLDFAVVDRVNPDEKEFRVLFSLVGLGSFGQNPFGSRTNGTFGRAPSSGSELGSVY